MKKEVVGKKVKKKIVIKNKKKLLMACIIFCLILVLIFLVCNKGVKIDDNTNILNINITKYSNDIKIYYDESMDKFINDHSSLQNVVWTYIYNNISSENTIESLIDNVNVILSSNDWSLFGIEKNTRWRGIFAINKTSNVLTFKFENKDIEPEWILDEKVSYIIEKN